MKCSLHEITLQTFSWSFIYITAIALWFSAAIRSAGFRLRYHRFIIPCYILHTTVNRSFFLANEWKYIYVCKKYALYTLYLLHFFFSINVIIRIFIRIHRDMEKYNLENKISNVDLVSRYGGSLVIVLCFWIVQQMAK